MPISEAKTNVQSPNVSSSDEENAVGGETEPELQRGSSSLQLQWIHRLTISFHFWTAARITFYHMFNPLTLPLLLITDGKYFARNMGYLGPQSALSIFGNYAVNILIWFVVVAHAILPASHDIHDVISTVEVVAMTLAWFAQRAMIGVKYAYMPQQDLELLRTGDVPLKRRLEEQLITGWMALPADLIVEMADLSLIRQGPEAAGRSVTFSGKQIRRWKRLLSLSSCALSHPSLQHVQDTAMEDIKHGRASVEAVIIALASLPVPESTLERIFRTYSAPILAVVQVVLPPIVRAATGKTVFGSSAIAITAQISLVAITLMYTTIAVLFLVISMADYSRRYHWMRRCGALLSNNLSADGDPLLPLINLHDPGNYRSWLVARRALLRLGLRFWRRIQLYSSLVLVGVLILAIVFVINVLQNNTGPVFAAVSASDFVVLVGVLAATVRYGDLANGQSLVHREIIAGSRVEKADRHARIIVERELASVATTSRSGGHARPVSAAGWRKKRTTRNSFRALQTNTEGEEQTPSAVLPDNHAASQPEAAPAARPPHAPKLGGPTSLTGEDTDGVDSESSRLLVRTAWGGGKERQARASVAAAVAGAGMHLARDGHGSAHSTGPPVDDGSDDECPESVLEMADILAAALTQALGVDDESAPLTIVGFRATNRLLQTGVALALSTFSAVLTVA